MSLNLPKLPPSKTYGELTTPEQDVLRKLIQLQQISKEEESILTEAIQFYKALYEYLQSIPLGTLSDKDAEELKEYLRKGINMDLWPKNKISFHNVFRVIYVRDEFLEHDKVRSVNFISYPPLDIIKRLGVYGRANTPESTVFYCAIYPEVALLESKPEVGQRIILAQWHNDKAEQFVSVPITNNKSIDNESLKAATKAFEEIKAANHPLFAEILDLYFAFISSEFVKDGPVVHAKKYEYFYSGFYSDAILNGQNDINCLIYPSVAHQHKSENLAIIPASVQKLRPLVLQDCIVEKTYYKEYDDNEVTQPAELKILRESKGIDNGRIIWNDD